MFFPFRCRTSHPNSVAFSKYEPFIVNVAGFITSKQQTEKLTVVWLKEI